MKTYESAYRIASRYGKYGATLDDINGMIEKCIRAEMTEDTAEIRVRVYLSSMLGEMEAFDRDDMARLTGMTEKELDELDKEAAKYPVSVYPKMGEATP